MAQGLAVKYRPRNLKDVAGQEAIKDVLQPIFDNEESIPSAFMIIGDTGVGKTTIARIIARTLNCEEGNGCGKCQSCKQFDADSGTHPDFYEQNAALARGIDDIREVIGMSKYQPTFSYRCILLDECFPSDTEVMLADGTFVEIGKLVENKIETSVVSYNIETNEWEHQPIISHSKNIGNKSLVEVVMSDGSTQVCTASHKWWSVTRNTWVEAQELMGGEQLLPFPYEGSAD